jgi:hypoxanthine phosphoribosyltransferase
VGGQAVKNIYPDHPGEYLANVLLTAEEIRVRIAEMGKELEAEYADKYPLLVCILKGASLFHADLIRCLDIPLTVDYMAVASYGASTKTTGVVKLTKDLDTSVMGRHVIIVEDIVDTGLTLNYLRQLIQSREPASVRVCSLLSKPARRVVEVDIDFQGFEIPDEFVIGYGLDYSERYRNLPYIGVLHLHPKQN